MTAIMKKESTALTIINFAADAGQGFENVDRDSVALPFLKLLQTNSPECDESEGEYIEGAKAGMFINTVTKEVLGASVIVVPCYYKRVFNIWGDRDKGGGYKGFYEVGNPEIDHAKTNEFGKLIMTNGDYLTDTRNHFILLLMPNAHPIPMLLSLTSTQIKKSKNWISQMQMRKLETPEGKLFTPPMYGYAYSVESVTEKNEKGSWKGVRITLKDQLVDMRVYEAAKEFAQQVRDNKVKVQEPVSDEHLREEF